MVDTKARRGDPAIILTTPSTSTAHRNEFGLEVKRRKKSVLYDGEVEEFTIFQRSESHNLVTEVDKDVLNTSTYSLRNSTLEQSFPRALAPTRAVFICNFCGKQEFTDSDYKSHLAWAHYKDYLMHRYEKSVKSNLCQICNFSSKAATKTKQASVMIVHIGVKHNKVYRDGNQHGPMEKNIVAH